MMMPSRFWPNFAQIIRRARSEREEREVGRSLWVNLACFIAFALTSILVKQRLANQ